MKPSMMFFFLLALTLLSNAQTNGTMKDPRDGKTYKTVKIGSKTWMAENLNYAAPGSCYYMNEPDFGSMYGRLYTWEVAINVCPTGWSLPTDGNWEFLITVNGGPEKAGIKLQESGSGSFNASLGGSRYVGGAFSSVGESGGYWGSTPASGGKAWNRQFYSGGARVDHGEKGKEGSFSVRCVQD